MNPAHDAENLRRARAGENLLAPANAEAVAILEAPHCEKPPEICVPFVGDGPCYLCGSTPGVR